MTANLAFFQKILKFTKIYQKIIKSLIKNSQERSIMLTLNKIYQSEYNSDFARDFLDPNYPGKKYLFGTDSLAKEALNHFEFDAVINTWDKMSNFAGKPVISDLNKIEQNALVLVCVASLNIADALLSAFCFRHLDYYAFSKAVSFVGGGNFLH